MTKEFMIFTDGGAFTNNNEFFDSVYAFLINEVNRDESGEILCNKRIYSESKLMRNKTCAYAEIKAISESLERMYQYIKAMKLKDYTIQLITDSMLCYNSLTEWVPLWIKKSKDGKLYNSSGELVKNQEEILKAYDYLLRLRKNGNVKLLHINSHTSKKKINEYRNKFNKFNKTNVGLIEFVYMFTFNECCDKMVKETYMKEMGTTVKK